MAKLIIHSCTAREREFELKAGKNSLGRGDDNDCKIDDLRYPAITLKSSWTEMRFGSRTWVPRMGRLLIIRK